MKRLIMDMPLMISAARWHAADHHGKTEVVALAIEGDTLKRHPLSSSRRLEAAGRTPPHSLEGGPAVEGIRRRTALKAIETQSAA